MPTSELQQKRERLKAVLSDMGSVAVAFSAGVDSTFLLKVTHDVLGDRAVAVTASTAAFPERERNAAAAFCEAEGIRLLSVSIDVFAVKGFSDNPPDRCYLCKKAIFSRLLQTAQESGVSVLVEGTNADDTGDYRPGMRAVCELGVRSPLFEVGLTKSEIRTLSREMGLPTWQKPALACLATRIPYGEAITPQKLRLIDGAELKLAELGFRQYRVRLHGDAARIEVLPDELVRFADPALRDAVSAALHQLGFRYVSLDLDGYRTGSLNAVLPKP